MSLESVPWRRRMDALLQAVVDVSPPDHPAAGAAGTPRHQSLFERYCKDLAKARRAGQQWYQGLIDSEVERTGDLEQGLANVVKRRPVGPVSDPDVTGTVRRYWLECVAVNESLSSPNRVRPEELVLKWLAERGHEGLAEFVSGYPFWPMGLDSDGRWV